MMQVWLKYPCVKFPPEGPKVEESGEVLIMVRTMPEESPGPLHVRDLKAGSHYPIFGSDFYSNLKKLLM